MNATLYYNRSDLNHLDKDLLRLGTITLTLKEQTNIQDPTFKLAGNYDFIGNCNYIYVTELGRYYFIKEVNSIRDGLWELVCHIDVLTTYKTYIRNQEAVISRQEYKYNLLLDDGTLKAYTNPMITTKAFEQSFNDDDASVICVIVGDQS